MLFNQRPVPKTEVLQRPDHAHVEVETPTIDFRTAVGTATIETAASKATRAAAARHERRSQGRYCSCRTRSELAATVALCEVSSGRFAKPMGIKSPTVIWGEIKVICSRGDSVGITTAAGLSAIACQPRTGQSPIGSRRRFLLDRS